MTCVYFNGAKNVQKAGDVITAACPRAFSFHGGEHVLSLFFSDIARIGQIRVRNFLYQFFTEVLLTLLQSLILKTCRLYNVFGSGASHAMYAQFKAQASHFNKGKRIGLLRGAGTLPHGFMPCIGCFNKDVL